MARQRSVEDPGDVIRRFRQTYTNYHILWQTTGSIPEGVTHETPKQAKLDESHLPEDLAEQLAAYREAHPDEKITLIKHMRMVGGEPQLVVEDDRGLPDQTELMTLARTLTVNTSETMTTITDLFVARRG